MLKAKGRIGIILTCISSVGIILTCWKLGLGVTLCAHVESIIDELYNNDVHSSKAWVGISHMLKVRVRVGFILTCWKLWIMLALYSHVERYG